MLFFMLLLPVYAEGGGVQTSECKFSSALDSTIVYRTRVNFYPVESLSVAILDFLWV